MSLHEQLHCSPRNSKYAFENSTCFSKKDLQLIAREYNRHSANKIKITGKKEHLLQNLREKLYDKCKHNEHCWTTLPFIDNKYRKYLDTVFRPPKPKEWYSDKNTWLNTLDILACMEQYQHLYKDFIFFGVYPIDGLETTNDGICYGDKMCEFSIKSLKNNINQFALILNTDPHDKNGLHWVSLYCNINTKKNNFGIYFYDSVGTPPPVQVKRFMKKIKSQIDSLYTHEISKNFSSRYNKTTVQFKGSECGIFSQVFITQMVKYIPFDLLCENMKNDDDINKLRDVLYRPDH